MAPFRDLWAVPIQAPPNGATKNPLEGSLERTLLRTLMWGSLKEPPRVLLNHKLGAEKNHLRFFIEPCGIHEGFFEEPHGIHITILLLTLRVT